VELLPEARHEQVLAEIDALVSEFERITRGMLMLNHRPPRSADEAVAIGERLSALLVSECLRAEGVESVAVNAAEVVVTDAVFGNASPLMEPTRERARARLVPELERRVLPVVTGFNGATADGRPTTLGRGGSDFSASILSAALGAAEVWIWTDVDGIMSADPRLVPSAAVLDEVTDSEAADLLARYADSASVSDWAKNSVAVCIGKGLVNGRDGLVAPDGSITRAEVAAVVTRLLKQSNLI
jgi:aspartate kinase